MITSLSLTNFRNHADTHVALQPITLMVGPAGSGKSNVFKALVLIQNSIHRTLPELFPPGLGEFHWVRSRWAGETDPISVQVDLESVPDFPGIRFRYTLQIADSPEGLYVLEETLQKQQDAEQGTWVFDRRGLKPRPMGEFGRVEPRNPTILCKVWHQDGDLNPNAPNVRIAKAIAQELSRFGYYHLEPSNLKSLGTGQQVERIQYDGSRLPDFIAWLKSSPETKEAYATIKEQLAELLPHFDDLIVTQTSEDRQGIAMSFRGHRGFIAAPDLSDGTMLTLGLLCMAYNPKRPRAICIEEPETGLHPRRLRWMFDRLMQLAYPQDHQEPVQVLLSTHSPYVVDLFRGMLSSVQIVEHREGRSRITPLPEVLRQLKVQDQDAAIGHEWATGLYEGL